MRDGKENTFVGINEANFVNKSLNKSNKGKQTKGNFLALKRILENLRSLLKGAVLFVENLAIMLKNVGLRKTKNRKSIS